MLTSIADTGLKCRTAIGVCCILTLGSIDAIFAAVPATIKATGTVEPHEMVNVHAQVEGTIQKIGVDPSAPTKSITYGSAVKKGTELAKLDPALYQAALTVAQADLRRAEASLALAKAKIAVAEQELERTTKRAAEKTATSSAVETAKAATEVARAAAREQVAAIDQCKIALKSAEVNLENCTLRSPIDGIVIDRRIKIGQRVAPSSTARSLFLIGNISRFEVWASVNEADIPRVTKGQPVRFTVDAFPNKRFTGRVSQTRLNAVRLQNRVTYTVVIDVDEAETKLLPYLTAEVEIDVGERP